MLRRMMLLINPNAGKGGYKSTIADVMEIFCRGGWQPTVFFTQASGQAPDLIAKNAENYDMIVCLGGDGTLSETVSGMMRLENKKPIGYIPLGTANDVARTLGLPTKPAEAAKQILSGKIFPFDVGKFGPESNYFTYIAAFGAFTAVSYATPQETKHALGHLAYMLEGLKSITKITSYKAIIEYDGGVIKDDFIFGAITNSTSIAGLLKLDKSTVNLSDGMFEILLVKTPQDLLDLNDIVTSITQNNFSGENVLFLRSSEVRILFDKPVSWTRDGESGGEHQDIIIVNCHPGVDLIV